MPTDALAEGLYVVDRNGRFMFVNAAAASMLVWTEDELRGKPAHATIHFQRADRTPFAETDCRLNQVLTTGRRADSVTDAFTRRDGSILPIVYSAAPLVDDSGTVGMVVVFRPVTSPATA